MKGELIRGSTREGPELEFKQVWWGVEHSRKDWKFELAKDLAALANSFGGRIVVGACEKDDVFTGYCDAQLPKKWRTQLDEVRSAWLSPEPVVVAKPVNWDSRSRASIQLVLDVAPSIHPVVVRDPADARSRFTLPIRVEADTMYPPVQEALLALERSTRTMMLKLRMVPSEREVVRLIINDLQNNEHDLRNRKWGVETVSYSTATLRSATDGLVVPLAYIEEVWQRSDREWAIRARGTILGDRTKGFVFDPRENWR